MGQFVSGTLDSIDFGSFSLTPLAQGDTVTHTATTYSILSDGELSTFTGQFVYDADGDISGGTFTRYTVTVNGALYFDITGISVDVAQFITWVSNDDVDTFYAAVLSGDDNLTGSPFDDYILGLANHDNLFGGAGADTLLGGDGNDHLYGRASTGGSDGADSLDGGAGSDYLQGNAGNDTLDGGEGSDRVNGGADNDVIRGSGGNDTANGNLGNDTIDGGLGNDSLRGGQGNDSIVGGSGNDMLSGDLGIDTLSGGAGTDTYIFTGAGTPASAPDRVLDYDDAADFISIGYRPAAVLTGSSSSLSAATSAAQQLFDGRPGNGEVAAIQVGSDTYLFFSSNGGGTVDAAIQMIGNNPGAFSTDDFV